MKAKGCYIILSIALLIFISAPSYAVETLRLGHHQAVNSMVDKTAKKFAELVEEKTGGEVKVKVFPSAQLGGESQAYELLHQGGIDATITSMGYGDKYYPPLAATTLPFVFRDWDHAAKAMRGDFGKMLIKGLKDNSNIQMVGILEVGPRDMMFNRDPIQSLSGLKGVKMRSPEQFIWIRMFELLGAKPTPIPWGEVYTTLQTGVVAGLDTPAQQAIDMKFYEVTNSLVKTGHIFLFMSINVNKNKIAKLKPEYQAAIESAGREAAIWSNETIIKPGVAAAYSVLEAKGIKVVAADDIDKWAEAVRPLWNEIGEKYEGAGEAIKALRAIK